MTDNIDELTGLELVAAFARAMGFDDTDIGRQVSGLFGRAYVLAKKLGTTEYAIWEELPADLIIQEFDRIKPSVSWRKYPGEITPICYLSDGISCHAEGPDFKTAMARLRIKLEEEKAK